MVADNAHCRPVYEYPLNGQWIMMDIDDGYILWTGIWKGALYFLFLSMVSVDPSTFISEIALGNSKGVCQSSSNKLCAHC